MDLLIQEHWVNLEPVLLSLFYTTDVMLGSLLRFRRTMDRIISFCLIFPYRDPLPPYHTQIHRTAPFFSLIPYPPHIFDRPWDYLSGALLILLSVAVPYLVRYIDSQSGGTVGLGLCPLRLITRSSPVAVYKGCTHSCLDLKSEFLCNQDFQRREPGAA